MKNLLILNTYQIVKPSHASSHLLLSLNMEKLFLRPFSLQELSHTQKKNHLYFVDSNVLDHRYDLVVILTPRVL